MTRNCALILFAPIEIGPLFVAIFSVIYALQPKPILLKATQEAHPYQVLARVCFIAMALLALWGWHLLRSSK